MNTQDAKKIPITEVLNKLGLQPVKKFKGGIELGYLSPFRGENEPSFFVNIQKNVWYDFAENGGNLLDFIMRYHNTDLRGALNFLDNLYGNTKYQTPFVQSSKKEQEPIPTFKLDKSKPFTSESMLAEYVLKKRKISLVIAQKYLSEVYFTNTETRKKYFAVGFSNLSGGFEIRNPYFKSSIGQKDISFISGSIGKSAVIFEGFIDFLSFLSFNHKTEIEEDVIILNTLSYVDKALKLIQSKSYSEVNGYLDNDTTGNEKTTLFQHELKFIFADQRVIFQPHKDFNEFLQSTLK